MSEQPLFEISRRSLLLNKYEEPSISWHDSVLTVRTGKGLKIFNLSHDLRCLDKKIDFMVSEIPCSKTSPATSLFTKSFMQNTMRGLDYNQLIVDPSLWPHNPSILEEMANIVAFEWSPPDFIYNNERVVAVLNNVGSLELYSPKNCGYGCEFNMSTILKEDIKVNLDDNFPESLEQLKKAVDAVETSAFCWGSRLDNSFFLVTAQKNGSIFFWLLQCHEIENKCDLVQCIHTELGEIITVVWIPFNENIFFLVCANGAGEILLQKYSIDNNKLTLIKSENLWSHKDRMVVKLIKYSIVDDKIVIICNKHRHLLVIAFDENCEKIADYVKNVNDHRITAITESNNDFYLGTINGNILKIDLIVMTNSLEVILTPVRLKDKFVSTELHDFVHTNNEVMCAMGVIDRKICYRKEQTTFDIVFLCNKMDHESEIVKILNNPSKQLTKYWDCIEMLRYKTMKLKILPKIDYGQLYANCKDNTYKLKVYYILLTLYNSLEKIIKNGSKGVLPETSIECIKEKLMACHIKELITKINSKYVNDGMLDGIESEALVGGIKFLKYYCKKYELDIGGMIPSNLVEKDVSYTCQGCDEVLEGYSCSRGHLNMFCSITMTPIDSDKYLLCKSCGVTARVELLPKKPMCIFCDIHFNNYMIPL